MDIFQERRILPNFGIIGPKFKQHSQQVADTLKAMSSNEIAGFLEELEALGKVERNMEGIDDLVTLTHEDFRVEVVPKEDIVMESLGSGKGHVVLDTTLNKKLLEEGLVRDLVRRIQSMRKDMALEYSKDISIGLESDEYVRKAVQKYQDYIQQETIATIIEFNRLSTPRLEKEWKILTVEGKTRTVTISLGI